MMLQVAQEPIFEVAGSIDNEPVIEEIDPEN
jgi:hypothetical protein